MKFTSITRNLNISVNEPMTDEVNLLDELCKIWTLKYNKPENKFSLQPALNYILHTCSFHINASDSKGERKTRIWHAKMEIKEKQFLYGHFQLTIVRIIEAEKGEKCEM